MKNVDDRELNTQQVLSPFHAGEQALQSRTGKRDAMENFGRRAIRSFMPDQHREFFSQLPFMVVGSVDNNGWPWASILPGRPGFVSSPTSTSLNFNTLPIIGDPLTDNIKKANAAIGFLGIELHTRRRNRLNGRINAINRTGFSVTVDQSFGNCPQYIQHRSVDFIREPNQQGKHSQTTFFDNISPDLKSLINDADTFFVSSFVKSKSRPDIEGVDVSHRGGKPGFVKVEGNTLTIPDYAGNFHFNTLGNFLLNPKAGLIFANFLTGDVFMLTGTVEIIWEVDQELAAFEGAERAWRFTLEHGVELKDGLPFRSKLGDFSPNSLLTGDWAEASARLKAQKLKDSWRVFNVAKIEDESDIIRSFYLEASDGETLPTFEAGQYITVKLKPKNSAKSIIRTYTVSSAPNENYYRISVKKEQSGLGSSYLHDSILVGDSIELKTPRGDFYIDPTETRPAVLLAGGVGITPMMSMAQHVSNEGIRRRHIRPLRIFHSAKTTKQRAFSSSLSKLQQESHGNIEYYSFVTEPDVNEEVGVNFNSSERISANILQQVLPKDDYDFYLCGPAEFMQEMYNVLLGLGVRDERIFAESFGGAAIVRQAVNNSGSTPFEVAEADESVINFSKSKFEQRWEKGDNTILEVAETHGLSPDFGCRTGSCGACKTKLNSGKIVYRTSPTAAVNAGEVLICCAVPAQGSDMVTIAL